MEDDPIVRRLKLRDLRVLLAVTKAGSMAKAATQLAISQPAISRAIADMEAMLGVLLFDRSPQGVEPTPYGRALIQRGATVFNELNQGVKDIQYIADPTAGELRFASTIGLSESIVLLIIDRLSQRYPRAVFNLILTGMLGQYREFYEELREHRVELGVLGTSGPIQEKDIDPEFLFEEPLVVVAGMRSPWVHRRKIELAELVNERWTWPGTESLVNSLILDAFRTTGLDPPRAAVYADPINMRTRLAQTGRYLAVVPASFMRLPSANASLKVLPVELPTTRRQIGIITLKNRTLSPLAQRFIECAREVVKSFPKKNKEHLER